MTPPPGAGSVPPAGSLPGVLLPPSQAKQAEERLADWGQGQVSLPQRGVIIIYSLHTTVIVIVTFALSMGLDLVFVSGSLDPTITTTSFTTTTLSITTTPSTTTTPSQNVHEHSDTIIPPGVWSFQVKFVNKFKLMENIIADLQISQFQPVKQKIWIGTIFALLFVC